MFEKTFKVAEQLICIEGAAKLPANLAPFLVQDNGEALVHLSISENLPERKCELYFRTEDGPGFPEIAIYQYPGGYRISFSALPGRPVAGTLDTTPDFREAQLKLEGPDPAFAINNALMLLFAFSSAGEGILEMHASVVMYEGKGYLFLGPSGTGKSTHSGLWLKHIAGTELLNDDNPILRMSPDGDFRVYGSPWSGKTPCYKAKDVPVGAIVRIRQAPENRIQKLPPVQAYASLMSSASAFRPFKELSDGWHRTLEAFATQVPCYVLDCLPDRDAALLCCKTVHG